MVEERAPARHEKVTRENESIRNERKDEREQDAEETGLTVHASLRSGVKCKQSRKATTKSKLLAENNLSISKNCTSQLQN